MHWAHSAKLHGMSFFHRAGACAILISNKISGCLWDESQVMQTNITYLIFCTIRQEKPMMSMLKVVTLIYIFLVTVHGVTCELLLDIFILRLQLLELCSIEISKLQCLSFSCSSVLNFFLNTQIITHSHVFGKISTTLG